MAVVVETTIGDFTIDLFIDNRPQVCKNFLKLCKMKYYNFCLFHSVQPNFLAQSGDPSGMGSGGESVYGLLYGEKERFFEGELMPKIKHHKPGLVSMVNCGNNMLGSQFFITLGEELLSLDGEHCVFGEITEGIEIIHKFNETICDTQHRPYKDIRITHTVILEDPFEDPSGLIVPDMSPEPTQERLANGRIGADEEIDETAGLSAKEIEELKEEREAKARATILEIVGDLPDAEIAPPENVLFVCKLNPVTTDDDLTIIFNRFGKIKSCEIIRDKTTGDSLQYGFIEFEDQKSCEDAYFKMDNVLIDDRRIKVDFSQSVAKERNIRWKGKGRGIEHLKPENQSTEKEKRINYSKEKEYSRNSRREKDFEERDRRRDKERDRERDSYSKERVRDKNDERYYQEREHKRNRSRSSHRRHDSKHLRNEYKDDDKRYDNSRKDKGSSKKKIDDYKGSTNKGRKNDDKRKDDRKAENFSRERKIEKRETSGRSSSSHKENNTVNKNIEKVHEKKVKSMEKPSTTKKTSPISLISVSNHKEIPGTNGCYDKSSNVLKNDRVSVEDRKPSVDSPRSSKCNERKEEHKTTSENDLVPDKLNCSANENTKESSELGEKQNVVKRRRKASESFKKKKKRHHSSSSESSSESSDSTESSSSSDSSDYRHTKKKKLIIAKKYYRGGKLVKEVKKKRRTRDSSETESNTEESTDSESKRRRHKKHKKLSGSHKQTKRRTDITSDEVTLSDSSDDSGTRSKTKKKKRIQKKSSKSSSKKKKRRKDSSSSSDSEDSDDEKNPK